MLNLRVVSYHHKPHTNNNKENICLFKNKQKQKQVFNKIKKSLHKLIDNIISLYCFVLILKQNSNLKSAVGNTCSGKNLFDFLIICFFFFLLSLCMSVNKYVLITRVICCLSNHQGKQGRHKEERNCEIYLFTRYFKQFHS